jgi:hypothetical protein
VDLVDIIESKRFLGGELLLWLWYESERSGGVFELPDAGEIALVFDDQLVLEAFLAETEQSRLSGGSPADSPEARSALRAGKRVSKAKLRLRRDEREFVFTMSAPDFDFSSVKVPAVLKNEDERLVERLSLLDELTDVWARLYREFLRLRLGAQWPRLEAEMRAWAQSGGAGEPDR